MRWTDGRGYVAPTQGNVNRSVQKNLEEIDRRLMRQQKPKAPGGGAFCSTLLMSSGALSGGFGDGDGFFPGTWTVHDTWGDTPPVLTPETKTGGEVYLRADTAGWYQLQLRFGIGFSSGGGDRISVALRGPHNASGFADVHASRSDFPLSTNRQGGILAAEGTLSCTGWIDPSLSDALIYAEAYSQTSGTLCSPTDTGQPPYMWLQVVRFTPAAA